MTESQLFSMSADFFDTSSNSSNTLKFDLYSLGSGLSSNSNSLLYSGGGGGSNSHLTFNQPTISIAQSNSSNNSYNNGTNNSASVTVTSSNSTSLDSVRESLMLTNAISIPRSSSSIHNNQLHHHPLHHHHMHQPRIMADLSDICLDSLEASSLSPTLLQDVSLSASAINSHSSNSNGNMLFPSELSPLSNSSSNGGGGGSTNSNSGNGTNSLGFDPHQPTPNSNTMWSDIGNAIIATKNEPFQTEDDYIFPIDKAEMQNASFPNFYDENILEDLNIEDLIPTNEGSYMLSPNVTGFHQLQNSTQLPSPQPSPAGPPQQLLEQQHQQQQQQQNQHNHQQHPVHHNQRIQQHQNSLGVHLHHNSFDERRHSSARHHGSSSPYEIYHSTPNKQINSNTAFSPGSQASPNSPLLLNSVTPPPPHANRSQYQQNMVKSRNVQLLKKEFSMSPDRNTSSSLLGQSVPAPSPSHILLSGTALSPGSSGFGSGRRTLTSDTSSRLSSSAPTHVSHLAIEQIWGRREPRQHLLSTGSLVEADSYSSLSTGSVLSPEGNDFSQDDEAYTDDDSEHYEDLSSDGSDNEDERTSTPNQLSSSKGKERFFWQYNVQAKGPKGKRLVFQSKLEDPHVLNEVTDPVFSPNCSVRGIKVFKHSGKARKGDGNDLTPNPRKLHSIGRELDKLSRTINDMTPVSELPFNVRPKSRKEKNKLASRACRLKKKAQHEANKIKLHGLEIEHKRLLSGIIDIKHALCIKYQNQGEPTDELDEQIEQIYKAAINSNVLPAGLRIAGGTTDFVNNVLDNVKKGISNGGLEDLRNS